MSRDQRESGDRMEEDHEKPELGDIPLVLWYTLVHKSK